MTDKITPALIASLRELEGKATPRPWGHYRARTDKGSYGLTPIHEAESEPDHWERSEFDVDYMVAAVNNLPALLDEVERLQAIAEEAKEDYFEQWLLTQPMPCGHPARYAVHADEGTGWCSLCVLENYQDQYRKVLSEDCADDEIHCSCVPVLRQRIAELEGQVAAYKNDLPLAQACERIAELEAYTGKED